jgi:hypothetical protein
MRRVICQLLSVICLLSGCGYTTRGCLYPERTIVIKAVTNEIDVTNADYRSIGSAENPILLEKDLTTSLIKKFNLDGALRVTKDSAGALALTCAITDYHKEALRYVSNDVNNPEQEKLYLSVSLKLQRGDQVIKQERVVGETSFYLSAKSEAVARVDLIEDAGRKILAWVVEDW